MSTIDDIAGAFNSVTFDGDVAFDGSGIMTISPSDFCDVTSFGSTDADADGGATPAVRRNKEVNKST